MKKEKRRREERIKDGFQVGAETNEAESTLDGFHLLGKEGRGLCKRRVSFSEHAPSPTRWAPDKLGGSSSNTLLSLHIFSPDL